MARVRSDWSEAQTQLQSKNKELASLKARLD
jgi:Tfp pilus assembly protein FimV